MKAKLIGVSRAFNELSIRERVIIVVAVLLSLLFIWWSLYAEPLILKSHELAQENARLATDIQVATVTNEAIVKRLADGVHKEKLAQIERGRKELQLVTQQLEDMAYELVEPDEMFDLMGQLVFADSGLKLSGLSRKDVQPVFAVVEGEDAAAQKKEQPSIYRHTMAVRLRGTYAEILRYVQTVEKTDWKLIWDSIRLKTDEYPQIELDIEMSTLSKSRQWVGL